MPAGPIANVIVCVADRVDVALLVDRLRRDLLAAVAPDDVLEDVADVLGLVERAEHGVDGARADLVAALDQLDELVDDRARLGDAGVVALERQLVAAQADRAVEPLAQRVEHAVADAGQLGGDVVRDRENFLQRGQCRPGASATRRVRFSPRRAAATLLGTRPRPARARFRDYARRGEEAGHAGREQTGPDTTGRVRKSQGGASSGRSGRSGELLADELADRRAVGAAGDLRHHVRHHPAEVAHARRADLGDRVVDDPLELVLGRAARA